MLSERMRSGRRLLSHLGRLPILAAGLATNSLGANLPEFRPFLAVTLLAIFAPLSLFPVLRSIPCYIPFRPSETLTPWVATGRGSGPTPGNRRAEKAALTCSVHVWPASTAWRAGGPSTPERGHPRLSAGTMRSHPPPPQFRCAGAPRCGGADVPLRALARGRRCGARGARVVMVSTTSQPRVAA